MPPALLSTITTAVIAHPFITAAAIGLASKGGGLLGGGQKGGSPAQPALPALPDPNKAQADAQEAITKQRKVLLATGGNVNQTQGKGLILGSDINTINLVGT